MTTVYTVKEIQNLPGATEDRLKNRNTDSGGSRHGKLTRCQIGAMMNKLGTENDAGRSNPVLARVRIISEISGCCIKSTDLQASTPGKLLH